jgi:hypothetical protein
MDRLRIAFGLLVVVMGTAWMLGGGSALRSGGRWVLSALPYALIALGLVLILRAALPKGLLTGPLALIAGGGLWAAYDLGYLGGTAGSKVLPGLVIVVGAALALGSSRDAAQVQDAYPLLRYRSVLWPVRRKVVAASPLVKVGVGSFFGDASIDLSSALFTADDEAEDLRYVLQVDVTVLFSAWTRSNRRSANNPNHSAG